MPHADREAYNTYAANWRRANRDKVNASVRKSRRGTGHVGEMLRGARRRAKVNGREFSLVASDITVPDVCPVLGMRLVVGGGDSAPSLDRIDSTKGYVPGNVAVISNRANKIKNNATAQELRKIADWMED